MSFKDALDNHPLWFGAGLVIMGFMSGWKFYAEWQSVSGQIPVSQERAKRAEEFEKERREFEARLASAERERDDLKRELSALQQSRKATEPLAAASPAAAGGTKPLESPAPGDQVDGNLNIALLGALKIPDHRLRDDRMIRIACQALRRGVADVAESAADSLSSAKSREKASLRSAAQAIASPHRPSPDWTTICR